jgi:hypothetical protein
MNKRVAMVMLMLLACSAAFADVINGGTSVNVNGTVYADYFGGGSTPLSAIPGMNTAGWNASTGLGTLTYTDTGAATRSFDFFVNLDLGSAFWNEFGVANGTLNSGESFQIDVPDFDCDANRCGNIIANTSGGSLDNLNHVPGQLDNYNFDCGADGGGSVSAQCNNDVSLALGLRYNVPLGTQAVLTFTLSNTAPSSGFYLSQTKPQDGENDAETVYFSENLAIQPLQAVPEPSSLALVSACFIALFLRHRKTTGAENPEDTQRV